MDAEVKRHVVDHVVRHARAESPHECCGILIGNANRVEDAVAAQNVAEHPATRFLIDPKDHLAAVKGARTRGLDVVGFYHSHPRSAAEPSATDLSEASYPDHLFLIVGLASEPADVRLYRFNGGNFLPLPLVTVA